MAPQKDSFSTVEVTLLNVAAGAMERDFQQALVEVDDVIANTDQYRANAAGELRMSIVGQIDLVVKDGIVTVIGGMQLKRPKRRTQKSALYRRRDGKGWRTDDNFEELALFGGKSGAPQDDKETTR